MSGFADKLQQIENLLNSATPSRNVQTQLHSQVPKVKQNTIYSSNSSCDYRNQESASSMKLRDIQNEIASKIRGINANAQQQKKYPFQDKQNSPDKQSSFELYNQISLNNLAPARAQGLKSQRSTSQGKIQTARQIQQDQTPTSSSNLSGQDNFKNLQKKLQTMRGEHQSNIPQERTFEDIYNKMRAGIPKTPSSIQAKGQNITQQLTFVNQKPSYQQEFQDFKNQTQTKPVQSFNIQEEIKKCEENLESLLKQKTFDLRIQEPTAPKSQFQGFDAAGDYRSQHIIKTNISKKYLPSKSSLSEVLSLENIRQIQSVLVECNQGQFEKLSPVYIEELSKLANMITHKIKSSPKHRIEIMNL